MRLQLFEFEDLPWFPSVIREGMVDYLGFVLGVINFYQPIVPLLKECLEKSGQRRIIDLCSGGGGAIERVRRNLMELTGEDLYITLTDKFPNLRAFEHLEKLSQGKITFIAQPIDALDVPNDLNGLRTMFSAFHHFRPAAARRILRNAVDNERSIAIFDGGDKNIVLLLGIVIFHPIMFFLFTPFFRPFRISRIFFTYILPLIPICTIWDGLISVNNVSSI